MRAPHESLGTRRVESLSDAVIAIAMTLLCLDLRASDLVGRAHAPHELLQPDADFLRAK
jgi:uncharacterized membrane protein